MRRILVAGIGNVFFGDDAFGVEVARLLGYRPLPPQVTVADFGIRSYDLAFAILEGYDATILVDAMPRGKKPGTVSLLEPDLEEAGRYDDGPDLGDGNNLDPQRVLEVLRLFGGQTGRVFVVGCEPGVLERRDAEMGLSKEVRAAVPQAIELIEDLITQLLGPRSETQPLALSRSA
jgi:hydrogenase maturation protease